MSGWSAAIMTAQSTVPTHFVAFCYECHQGKTFSSERERDLWMKHHTHAGEASA